MSHPKYTLDQLFEMPAATLAEAAGSAVFGIELVEKPTGELVDHTAYRYQLPDGRPVAAGSKSFFRWGWHNSPEAARADYPAFATRPDHAHRLQLQLRKRGPVARRRFVEALTTVLRRRVGAGAMWPALMLFVEPADVCRAAVLSVQVGTTADLPSTDYTARLHKLAKEVNTENNYRHRFYPKLIRGDPTRTEELNERAALMLEVFDLLSAAAADPVLTALLADALSIYQLSKPTPKK